MPQAGRTIGSISLLSADGFCIHDGPSHVDLLVVAYHRNDVGSIIIRIGVGMATNGVDLLDVVEVCTLS